jgi:hypothetical protein
MPQLISAIRSPERPIRFVVLSQPRTGSSLLCGSIRWHPQILMHGELLNPYYGEDLPREGEVRFRTAMSMTTHDAVGCKLHACQPNPDCIGWEAAWDELFADPTIKLVYLTRQNPLAADAGRVIHGGVGSAALRGGIAVGHPVRARATDGTSSPRRRFAGSPPDRHRPSLVT